jgi:outer membrane receptor protein involved in Fe transport
VDRTYTDVLPSFNIAWDITDTLVLRGAASKVIARPATPTSQHRAPELLQRGVRQ